MAPRYRFNASYQRRDWLPDLPPPPEEFFRLMTGAARAAGLWLRAARDERVRRDRGGRYWLTLPQSIEPLFASDELEAIRAFCNRHRLSVRRYAE